GPLELEVEDGVFIGRPETVTLAEWAVQYRRRGVPRGQHTAAVVVDLCSGSGALAARLAAYRPAGHIFAVELSDAALPVTTRNLAGTGVEIKQADVTSEDLLTALSTVVGKVDVVVTNPPYVPEDPNLSPEVYFDPHDAVFSGVD